MAFYTREELEQIGFNEIGENVLISTKSSIYGAQNISLGNNIRIDDFTILSGTIILGNYIHIGAYSALFGGEKGIEMEDYSAISSRCAVYAISDDYSGNYMTNPTVPSEYTNVIQKKVTIGRHVDVGTNSTILPGVTIGEGCSFGAMTLITKDTKPWGIYMGYQCMRVSERSRNILDIEKRWLVEINR